MLTTITTLNAVRLIAAVAAATIIGAWIFEYFGYAPCELCLMQRWAYYVAIPLSLALLVAASPASNLFRYGLVVLTLIWFGSMVFGIFHSGVEWGWWPGPTTCTGTGGLSDGLPDLSKPVVMCDTPAIRIFGLSLAGWNAVISAGLALAGLAALRRQGSSSVSQ